MRVPVSDAALDAVNEFDVTLEFDDMHIFTVPSPSLPYIYQSFNICVIS